jgi:N4-bis(aminopropyl)spermidine synthase
MPLDLRTALNAISDVTENRPLPLREFDQIYMKAGDMVVHTEFVARQFHDRDVVFVGDGDAIGLSIAHFMGQGLLDRGPRHITVVDFDERMVASIQRFADDFECGDRISAELYNVIDAVPDHLVGRFGAFHINPPWGQHNEGESVAVFLERGIQMLGDDGVGIVVIADDPKLHWTNTVLARTQATALAHGMIVAEMLPALHFYHLEDAPDLQSCAIIFRKTGDHGLVNARLPPDRLENFYGRTGALRVQYVRQLPDVWRRQADDRTYRVDPITEQEAG